jgi:DNA-binding protein H-NS
VSAIFEVYHLGFLLNPKKMSTLNDLLAQKAALEDKIAEARKTELNAALATIRSLVDSFGLTASDIFEQTKTTSTKKQSKNTVSVKYRDPITGNTWSGRGLTPRWMAGKDKTEFLIK